MSDRVEAAWKEREAQWLRENKFVENENATLRYRLAEAERLLRNVGTLKFSYSEIDAFLAGEKP